LPANPAGVARLEAALRTIGQPPEARPISPLPETAKLISGKTFVFGPNPLEMETAIIEFDDSAQAVTHIILTVEQMQS